MQGHSNLRLPNTNMYYNHRLDNIPQHHSYNYNHHHLYYQYRQQQVKQQHKYQQYHFNHHQQSHQIHNCHQYLILIGRGVGDVRDIQLEQTSHHDTSQSSDGNDYDHDQNPCNSIDDDNNKPFHRGHSRKRAFPHINSANLRKSFYHYCQCLKSIPVSHNECIVQKLLPNGQRRRTAMRKYFNVCGNFRYSFCNECSEKKHTEKVRFGDVFI